MATLSLACHGNLGVKIVATTPRSALSSTGSSLFSGQQCIPLRFSSQTPSRARNLSSPRASIQTLEATALPQTWPKFADSVGGEWAGYSSDFDSFGRPLRLPQVAIPEPFRSWGLDLFAWQTDCITRSHKENGGLQYSCTRLLPAVAAQSTSSYQEDSRQAGIGQEAAGVLAYRNDGCYALAWPGETVSTPADGLPKILTRIDTGSNGSPSSRFFELEHCMVAIDPTCEEQQARARVRLLQRFEKPEAGMGEGKLPKLVGMTLYRERWVGDGAGGYTSGGVDFAEGPQVTVEAIEGKWIASLMRADLKLGDEFGRRGAVVELSPAGQEEVTRTLADDGSIILPQGVWSRVLPTQDGGIILKAGWLVEPDRAIVSRFDYTSKGRLERITISTEERISTKV